MTSWIGIVDGGSWMDVDESANPAKSGGWQSLAAK
jgi:hypothetical protein